MDEKASYFATPAVGLIFALDVGLKIHLAQGGVEQRFKEHSLVASAFRAGLAVLQLKTVAAETELCASTLTGIYYPEGINGDTLRAAIKNHGAIVAGGLHALIGTKYFRVGHMGHSVKHFLLVLFVC
jgi:alanine-glyoxylate transaminase/serine-glyoxylate transaminase/serine-pyruvate transaminase